MANDPPQTPERLIRPQTPGAPKTSKTPGLQYAVNYDPHSKTPTPEPRLEPHEESSLSVDFSPPVPPLDPSLVGRSDQQRCTCPRSGCYETMPHEPYEVSDISNSEQPSTSYDEFQALLDSINQESANDARQASDHDNGAILDLVHRTNMRNASPDPTRRHAEFPIMQDGHPLEVLISCLEEVKGKYQDQDRTQCKMAGSHLGVFRVDRPFPEPEQPHQHVPQIVYAEPARPDRCISPTCPVHELHGVGLYVHNSEWGVWPNITFGIANPPDYIWAAEARRLANRASPEDIEMVRQFVIHHDHPYPSA